TDGTAAAPSPAAPSAPPAAAHPRSAPASVPPPDPPEHEDPPATPEEDELHSPVTQIAPIDDEDGEHSEPAPAPRRAPAHRPAAPAAAGSELENTGAYDDLFGKTVFRRIEDAAAAPRASRRLPLPHPRSPTPARTPIRRRRGRPLRASSSTGCPEWAAPRRRSLGRRPDEPPRRRRPNPPTRRSTWRSGRRTRTPDPARHRPVRRCLRRLRTSGPGTPRSRGPR